jgi:hypothetical protein
MKYGIKKMKKNAKKTVAKKAVATECTMCCPVTGAPLWKLLISTLLCFAFIFGFNAVLHGELLMPIYEHTKHLWRTTNDMHNHFHFMLLTQLVTAFVVSGLYAKYCGGCGVMRGLRFGVLIGILFGTMSAASYAWMPISWDLAQAWFFGGFAQGIGLGLICWMSFKSCESKEACSM